MKGLLVEKVPNRYVFHSPIVRVPLCCAYEIIVLEMADMASQMSYLRVSLPQLHCARFISSLIFKAIESHLLLNVQSGANSWDEACNNGRYKS